MTDARELGWADGCASRGDARHRNPIPAPHESSNRARDSSGDWGELRPVTAARSTLVIGGDPDAKRVTACERRSHASAQLRAPARARRQVSTQARRESRTSPMSGPRRMLRLGTRAPVSPLILRQLQTTRIRTAAQLLRAASPSHSPQVRPRDGRPRFRH